MKNSSFSKAIDQNNSVHIKSHGELLLSLPKIKTIPPMGQIKELSSFLNEVVTFTTHQL